MQEHITHASRLKINAVKLLLGIPKPFMAFKSESNHVMMPAGIGKGSTTKPSNLLKPKYSTAVPLNINQSQNSTWYAMLFFNHKSQASFSLKGSYKKALGLQRQRNILWQMSWRANTPLSKPSFLPLSLSPFLSLMQLWHGVDKANYPLPHAGQIQLMQYSIKWVMLMAFVAFSTWLSADKILLLIKEWYRQHMHAADDYLVIPPQHGWPNQPQQWGPSHASKMSHWSHYQRIPLVSKCQHADAHV